MKERSLNALINIRITVKTIRQANRYSGCGSSGRNVKFKGIVPERSGVNVVFRVIHRYRLNCACYVLKFGSTTREAVFPCAVVSILNEVSGIEFDKTSHCIGSTQNVSKLLLNIDRLIEIIPTLTFD
ncbi:unnamed protein product [Phytophthora lilii]|uniref:Unnamed protein product n=1 Tax=Phytophthora lilii TaxID=2077276 RepID=A0A9W6WRM5_9STRA|nr:unnamed protein product [Phytophthora lilii]